MKQAMKQTMGALAFFVMVPAIAAPLCSGIFKTQERPQVFQLPHNEEFYEKSMDGIAYVNVALDKWKSDNPGVKVSVLPKTVKTGEPILEMTGSDTGKDRDFEIRSNYQRPSFRSSLNGKMFEAPTEAPSTFAMLAAC